PAGPVMTVISGTGPAGSVRVLNTIAIGTAIGSCSATFCSDSDPVSARGTPRKLPFSTGKACGQALEANDDPTFNLDCGDPVAGCCSTGVPANCANLTANPPNISGLSIAGTFPAVDQPSVGDVVVTTQFVAQ